MRRVPTNHPDNVYFWKIYRAACEQRLIYMPEKVSVDLLLKGEPYHTEGMFHSQSESALENGEKACFNVGKT